MTLPDIDSSVTPEEMWRLREVAQGSTVLEVGSWRGFSTVAMAQVATIVHAVDWHLGDEHAGHDESLGPLMSNIDHFRVRDRVVVHVGDAAVVLPLFAPGHFDVAFVDAYHEADAVRRDAELVLPLVREGGHIAFHDYGLFGVKDAVDTLEDLEWVDLVGTLAVLRKR